MNCKSFPYYTSLKGIIILAVLLLLMVSNSIAQQTARRDRSGRGYLEYLPPDYDPNGTKLYPVIFFLHGFGERGDGSPSDLEKLKKNGPPRHIKNGVEMCFEYNGQQECFIVLSPQQYGYRGGWQGHEVNGFIDNVIGEYKIDPDRVYLMGLSMGGRGTWYAAYDDTNVPNRFAAISIAAGAGDYDKACIVAQNNVAVWAFHGDQDNQRPVAAGERPIRGMMECDPDPIPRFTVYEGVGHNSWGRAFSPTNNYHTPNVYQWLLAQRMGEPDPIPPTVDAGANIEITLPVDFTEINASASDTDGSIQTILWEQTSGPSTASLINENTLNLTVNDLIEGQYSFSIVVTDNDGLSSSDNVVVTVLPPPPNQPPDVNAGSNSSIVLPTNSINLNGSASDNDGTITSTLWSQLSGPSTATINDASALATQVSDLVEGNYTFELRATDDDGDFSTDNIVVTVQPEPPNDPPSVATASNVTITLPTNSTEVSATVSDSDGTITSLLWSQDSGPAAATITSPTESTTEVTDLVEGVYQFSITATDDDGDSTSDQITVTVQAEPPNNPPSVDGGADQEVTLPTNEIILNATASDTDGSISSVSWSQNSGPTTANIQSPNQLETIVSDLAEGLYSFSIIATDDDGDSSSDLMNVRVNPVPPDDPPRVDAGDDITITLPTNSTLLSASATDNEGPISSVNWELISGDQSAIIQTPTNLETDLTNLSEGLYELSITVSDNIGQQASDVIQVVVLPQQNTPPTVNTEADLTIVLPTNNATLEATAADVDGSIESIEWEQENGPSSATIIDPQQLSTEVQDLVEGVYTFRISATDNDGASSIARQRITVEAEVENIPPTANAGADVYLNLPTDSATLMGSGSDQDGSIVSYYWDVIQADGNVTINNLAVQNLKISELEAGVYLFALYVTDDDGATSSDQVSVFVDDNREPPVVNAGSDISIQLPQDSALLTGSATDADGNIVTIRWEQLSGPSSSSIENESDLSTFVRDLVSGVYTYNLYVEDNDGLSDQDEVTIIVNEAAANNLPLVDAGVDKEVILPANTVQLQGSVSDSDGTIVSVLWEQISGPVQLNANDFTGPTLLLSSLVSGKFVFRLTATDDDGGQASDEVRLTIYDPPGNLIPTVNAGQNQDIFLPTSTIQLNGSAVDSDGTISNIIWEKINGPAGSVIQTPDDFTTEITGLQEGIYTFRLSVEDNDGASSFDQLNVRVNPEPLNIPPTVDAGENINLYLPETSTTLQATALDSDGDINTIAWSQNSGPSVVSFQNNDELITSISNLQLGTYVIRVEVTDDDGASSFDEINVRVFEQLSNQPPTVNAGSNQLIYLPVNSTSLNGSAVDSDGSIASVEWQQSSGPNAAILSNSLNYSTEMSGLIEGSYVINLTATDNEGLTSFDQVVVRVNPELPNNPPVVNAGENVVVNLPQNTTQLIAEADDEDGSIVSQSWTQLSGPNNVLPSVTDDFTLNLTNLQEGFYVFRFSAQDDDGLNDYDDVSVTVNKEQPKSPPTVNAGEDLDIILPINTIQLSGLASDSQGAIRSVSWEQLSGPSQLSFSQADQLQTEVSGFDLGIYSVRLLAENEFGLKSFDILTLYTVENRLPIAIGGNDTTLFYPVDSYTLEGFGQDLDGQIVNTEWSQLEGPTATDFLPEEDQPVISDLLPGSYLFQFTVTDDKSAQSSDLTRIQVVSQQDNQLPVINLQDSIVIRLPDNSVLIEPEVQDVDGEIDFYSWSVLSASAEYFINDSLGSSLLLADLSSGFLEIQLTVVDNAGGMDSANTTLVIQEPREITDRIKLTKVFTPNGDDINDRWYSEALEGVTNCSIKIYNRAGQLVYESSEYENNWDGLSNNGTPLNSGAYYYILKCAEDVVIKAGVRIQR